MPNLLVKSVISLTLLTFAKSFSLFFFKKMKSCLPLSLKNESCLLLVCWRVQRLGKKYIGIFIVHAQFGTNQKYVQERLYDLRPKNAFSTTSHLTKYFWNQFQFQIIFLSEMRYWPNISANDPDPSSGSKMLILNRDNF